MTLRLYLAGPSVELGRVIMMARRLEEAGVELTCRWWTDVQARNGAGDDTLSLSEQRERALACMDGIDRALIVWALWPADYSHGTACELGYALAHSSRRVIVSGSFANECVFTSYAAERFAADFDALQYVLSLAAEHSPLAVVP